jgi:hypothetical protein
MNRIIMVVALVAVLAPAAFAAEGGASSTTPAAACKAELAKLGAADFKALYAPTGSAAAAMGNCVSSHQRSDAANRVSAQKACATERDMAVDAFKAANGGKTFNEVYGSNAGDRNAFGKCVSAKASAKNAQQEAATLKAARACKAERGSTAQSRSAFKTTYGGKANAFAKCVAAKKSA